MEYDVAALAKEFGVEPEDLQEIYADYFMEAKETLDKLKVACESNDLHSSARFCHSLRGASANLQMNRIRDFIISMEEALKTNQTQQALALLSDIRTEIQDAQRTIEEYYSHCEA